MADQVHHIHTDSADQGANTAMLLVVLLLAILAIAAFAFFAFNGSMNPAGNSVGTPDNDINIEGSMDLPNVTPDATAPGSTTNP